jgi:hypothetical protein
LTVEESTPRPESGDEARRRWSSRRTAAPVIVVVMAVSLSAVALYWWWPGIAGRGESFDSTPAVMVVGGGQLARSEEKVLRRLREEGYSALWGGRPTDWCEVRDAVTSTKVAPTRAVVMHAPVSEGDCADPEVLADDIIGAVDAFDARAVLVIGLEVADRDDPVARALIERGVAVVDPADLIGDPTAVGERVDCLWWDDCVFEGLNPGYVVLRDEDGLTEAGQQRVARLIVATVQ